MNLSNLFKMQKTTNSPVALGSGVCGSLFTNQYINLPLIYHISRLLTINISYILSFGIPYLEPSGKSVENLML